jgi:hypothetical protein
MNLKIDAGAAFLSAVECIISIKDMEGSMLVIVHVSAVHTV